MSLNYFLPVCYVFFLLCAKFADSDRYESAVMKVNKNISSHAKSPVFARDWYREDTGNNQTASSTVELNSNFYFPSNLKLIVDDILKNLRNEQCVAETTFVLEAMEKQKRWALEMFDSFSKFPVGLLYGNHFQMGNFDECIRVNHGQIKGQYCLADVHFEFNRSGDRKTSKTKDNNSSLHWGVCLSSSCTSKDAETFVVTIFKSLMAENFHRINVTVDEASCYFYQDIDISTGEIVYGCIVGFFIMLAILASGYHYWYIRKRKRSVVYSLESLRSQELGICKQVFLCFSLIRNTGKLLQIRPNELNLECICGIKFLSMGLIIAGHSLIFLLGGPTENANFFEESSTELENGIFLNNALLVDTFLFVSGFLMCRLLLIEFEKRNGKINFLVLYVARYIRLTPAYMVIIGFYMTWLFRVGNGPLWRYKVGLERDRCINSWWTNLLYVNNYLQTDELCMFQSWYLAVDYHLFILAPFIIYFLWKFRTFGKCLLGVCTAISIGVPFWLTYSENLGPTLIVFPQELKDISTNAYFSHVYIKTHMRASSYCIGLIFGYMIHRLQSSGHKLRPSTIWIGSMIAAPLGIASMYSIGIFYHPNHKDDQIENAFYASLHRVAWCLSVGWVVLLCITDNAEIVNKCLSWKPFIPASRLTYCAYLANGFVEIYNSGVQRQSIYLSKYELACKILGHLILTFTIAFWLCIFFESPLHGLEKILLKKDVKRSKPTHNASITTIEGT